MPPSRQSDEVSLIPYQTSTFEEQERLLSECTSQVSAQLNAVFSGQGVDVFRDNTLASAWYLVHQDSLKNYVHFSDRVGHPHLVFFAA